MTVPPVIINKKGFTLMEVMVAIAIIAIISGPMLQTFITSARVGRHSYDTDQANAVTVKTVEQLKGSPDDINDILKFQSSEMFDPVSGFFVNTYERTQYYDIDWQLIEGADDSDGYPFRVETTLTGSRSPSGISLSYIPELVRESGLFEGQSYHIDVDYEHMSTGTYPISIVLQDGNYKITATAPVLSESLNNTTAITHTIPSGDCLSGIIPFVVSVPPTADGEPVKFIILEIDNRTGAEAGIYIYGDYDDDGAGHSVTASIASGAMSVSYMRVSAAPLDYDKLDLNVKVIKADNLRVITDYTTMLYISE